MFHLSHSSDRTNRLNIPVSFIAVGGVLLFIAAVYLQAVFFDFAYDDFGQIVYNPGIKSWGMALAYFHSHVWAQTGGVALYYRPLYMLWLAANYTVFGLNPLYWHLAAIALHVIFCLLLYFLAYHLTEDQWLSTVAVLLFGLHPVHIEAVVWVSGATETLLGILLLGSLLCYFKHRDSGSAWWDRWGAASLCLAALAVLTKETGVILPGIVFSYEWIFHKPATAWKSRLWVAVRAAVPYAVISFAGLIVRALALKRLTPPHTNTPLLSIVLAWPKIIVFYAVHMLFPLHLTGFYQLFTVPQPGLKNFVLPLILTLAGLAGVLYEIRRSRVYAFLAAWCAILLIPMLNVTFLYNVENVHDRYLYLPSAAFCILLAAMLARLKQRRHAVAALMALTVLASGYSAVTIRESQYWRNDEVLAQHAIDLSPGHPLASQVLGNAYIREGRGSEAIPYLMDSLQTDPDNSDTLRSLGICYAELGALPLAEECLTKSIKLDNSRPETHLMLGVVRLKQKRLDEAEAEIRRGLALRHAPKGVLMFHYYLGNVLYAKGDVEGAKSEYRLELKNDPSIDPAVATAQSQLAQIEEGARRLSGHPALFK